MRSLRVSRIVFRSMRSPGRYLSHSGDSNRDHDHSHSHDHHSKCDHNHSHNHHSHNHNHSNDHTHKNKDDPSDPLLAGIKFKYYHYLVEHISPYMTKVFQPRLVQATKTSVLIELPFSPLLVGNPQVPCLHGGAVATMIDHAGGFMAWASLDDPKQRVNTADLRIDYLLPAPCELLLFEATILHKSKKLIRTDIQCYDRVKSAISIDPTSQKRTINLDAYQNKRLVATGRGLFNVYNSTSDLNVVMEKALQARMKQTTEKNE